MDDPGLLSDALAFGSEEAARLLPQLKQLEKDFFASKARHTAHDVAEMANQAIQDFHRLHPEISREAAKELARLYTFNYK